MDNQEMLSYLPEAKEVEKLPKQYLVNLVYAVVGDDFKAWVHDRIQQRNSKVTVEKDLMINFDEEIAAAFMNSTAVSL